MTPHQRQQPTRIVTMCNPVWRHSQTKFYRFWDIVKTGVTHKPGVLTTRGNFFNYVIGSCNHREEWRKNDEQIV